MTLLKINHPQDKSLTAKSAKGKSEKNKLEINNQGLLGAKEAGTKEGRNLHLSSKTKTQNSGSRDTLGRTYGTGRRKSSVARVWVKSGKGNFVVNNRQLEEYFRIPSLSTKLLSVFSRVNSDGKFDVFCTVKGGGYSGQVGAIQLGIARALDKFDETYHVSLRKSGFLTRDSRVVERKKYGKKKARKSTQFSKR